jgi:Mrp family chromosome partitioning ATPase
MRARIDQDFRRAATALALAIREHRYKSVLVASPSRGEGTTTVALSLAVQLRENFGMKPLVIEINRRRPVFAKLFHIDNDIGLVSVGCEKASLCDAIQPGPAGIALLPIGQTARRGEVLPDISMLLCRILHDVESKYQAVLIDAPPVLEEPDVAACVAVVPRVVLVVKAGKVRFELVERVRQELSDAAPGFSMVGAVLNDQPRFIPGWLYHLLFR